MSVLLWLAGTIALVPVVGDVPAGVGTTNDPECGQAPQKIRMEIVVALVHRTAMRSRDIHFPEAKNADQPTVAALKDWQRFMTFLRELQQEELGRIRAETVAVTVSGHAASLASLRNSIPAASLTAVTVSGHAASLASHPGDKAKPRAVPPPRIVPSVRPDGQIHVLLDVTEWVGKKRSPGAGTVSIQVKDGQTLVLTGVVFKYVTLTIEKIPILGDIPFAGRLFTSNHYAEEEGELVVLVTPHLVGKN